MKPRRTLTPASTQPRPDPTHRSNTWLASRLIAFVLLVIGLPIAIVSALSPAPPAPSSESIERRVRDDLAASHTRQDNP